MHKVKFIFDVDGTLTPSRGRINDDFRLWFTNFTDTHEVYLVTGSDYSKTEEQIGSLLCHTVKRVYNCSGNSVWEQGKEVYRTDWTLPSDAETWLNDILRRSIFPLRTGLHIEHRPGMVNFSVVGRNANAGQRAEYVLWDNKQNERNEIAQEFNYLFPELQANVGGETGLDIGPKGSDKAQILKDFGYWDHINFYGDAMFEGGNDFPLAVALVNGKYTNGFADRVTGWKDTWEKLKAVG